MEEFGKGDWKSISRKYLNTRTPAQISNHASKHFIRLNSVNRRRPSIFDITTVSNQAPAQPQTQPQQQTQPHHPGATMAGLGMHGGAPVGQPIIAPPDHMGSAVRTPVMLPSSSSPSPPIPQQHQAPSTMH